MTVHTTYSEIDRIQWKELIERSPVASYFQTPECFEFYSTLSFIKPFVFGVSENNKLVGILSGYITANGNFVKRYFSKRAIVCGGAMLDSDISEAAIKELLNSARKALKRKVIYLEIRNYNNYADYRQIFESCGFSYSPHLNFHVTTPDVETALKNLSTTRRREIKLSVKSGAEWNETKKPEDIKAYYRILEDLYKKKVRTPLFPLEFFEKLIQHSDGKLFVIKLNNEIIGGSVCVALPGKILYEWFVCGQDGQFKNVYPSTIATWAAIEYASKNEFMRFDMMGAGKPDDGYGVREFKSKFGGELVQYGRFKIINNQLLFKIGEIGISIIRNNNKSFGRKYTQKNEEIIDHKSNENHHAIYKFETDIEKIDKHEWSEFVMNHPNGNIFQTPKLFEIYENTKKSKPNIIIVINENNKIVGCLMFVIQREYKGLIGNLTTRSIVTGGPLADNNDEKIIDLLLNKYNQVVKNKAIYSQFRNMWNVLTFNESFQRNGYYFESHLDYEIDVTQKLDDLWNNIHEGRRKKIKKALKNGLKVEVYENEISENIINQGYNIIYKIYKRAKLPLSEIELFKNAIDRKLLVLFVVVFEEKIVGCRFAFKYKDLLFGWYAGSDFKVYNLFPNDLLIWETLKWGKENNYRLFDYGGAGNPNKPYGVRKFKSQVGGKLVNYGRYEIIHKKTQYFFAVNGFKIWKLIIR